MSCENPTADQAADDPTVSIDHKDLEDEALVLDRLLHLWPAHLQEADLQRELQIDATKFGERDRIERAVHHLFWAGLAMRCGPAVVPTRAALHYHRLNDETTVGL